MNTSHTAAIPTLDTPLDYYSTAMSKTKIIGDQERKAERKAAKAAAKAIGAGEDVDVKLADAGPGVKKEKKEKKEKEKKEKKEKVQKEIVEMDVEKNGESQEEKGRNAKREEKQRQEKEPTADSPTKKRKRNANENELEIDVGLPRPPSKKALRKLKKHPELAPKILKPTPSNAPKGEIDKSAYPEHSSQARSKHGIWIGNLAFSTTADTLREFIALKPEDVTRVNLPTDERGRNKGFAYIDFGSAEALDHALKLSESLLGGRKVLIKNSKDFSKRPASTPAAPKNGANIDKNPPSRILYVGNLDFSTTTEVLQEHFSFAGKIQRVRLATFEDSGKCKGFGFVDFLDVDSVRRAMLGLTAEEEEMLNEVEGKAEVELASRRKKRVMLIGRTITMEYGQDPSVRYKKRFGGKDKQGGDEESERPAPRKKEWKDNRSADVGAAYSSDVRRTGAITAGEGKKMTFDD